MNEVLRQEKKYPIDAAQGAMLRARLDRLMLRDAHNGAQGYRIRSLYFDTLDDQDFSDKVDGLELRRKIRLRAYSPDADFAMLEIKQKQGPYQRKRSLRLSRADADACAAGITVRSYSMTIRSLQSVMGCCTAAATGRRRSSSTGGRPILPGKPHPHHAGQLHHGYGDIF